jgi:diacylglycerol kinase family enzyme
MAGAGYDALIVRILAEERRGAIRMHQYAGWGIKALLRHRPPRIRVAVDGRPAADDASFVIAASSASYGGPVTFTPAARPDDGLLDVAIFRGRGIDDLLRWIAAAWLGRADRDGLCRIVRGREVRLESDDAVDVQVDGDPAGTLPAAVTLMEKALTVLIA